jgi:hypothetical protein
MVMKFVGLKGYSSKALRQIAEEMNRTIGRVRSSSSGMWVYIVYGDRLDAEELDYFQSTICVNRILE